MYFTMAATQLRTELLRELGPIFDSEPAMEQALDAIRRIRITYLRVEQQPQTGSQKKDIRRSARLQWLHDHPLKLSAGDLEDERTNYIVSK